MVVIDCREDAYFMVYMDLTLQHANARTPSSLTKLQAVFRVSLRPKIEDANGTLLQLM